MTIRIALVDDHRLFREALRVTLAQEPDLEVVAEAGSGKEALDMVGKHLPEVLLLDIALPDTNGIEVAYRLLKQHPVMKIIALTGYSDRLFVEEMLKVGARGYVVKSAGSDELIRGIHAVAEGHKFLSMEATEALLQSVQSGGPLRRPPLTVLSKREQQVLRLLAEGQRSSQIAEELGISVGTVEVHRRKLKAKLGIRSTAELTRYAIREGLTSV